MYIILCENIVLVPVVLNGPEDVALEYTDNLTATFNCTAFGGNGSEIDIIWASDFSNGLQPPQEVVNSDRKSVV